MKMERRSSVRMGSKRGLNMVSLPMRMSSKERTTCANHPNRGEHKSRTASCRTTVHYRSSTQIGLLSLACHALHFGHLDLEEDRDARVLCVQVTKARQEARKQSREALWLHDAKGRRAVDASH